MTASVETARIDGVKIDRGAWSWALFEWARNPWVLLGTIYVFAPYISNVVIGDPVRGQAMIAGWHATAGMIIAITSPFLGAASDRMGASQAAARGMHGGLGVLRSAIEWWALPNERGTAALGARVVGDSHLAAWRSFTPKCCTIRC
jgi:UMF1 family MFS transporter